ncbi:TRAP transporter small permease [Ramlibacter sp. AN1015]|uniref:TRAP transporter small permease n=1 Tax=Ramlibacter sp. AN1015 TaxID=3133428 RepID=UPI0030C47282
MKKLLELLCGLLCGCALFAIMVLTFFDVLGRKFASNSIPGSLEMTELLMVVVIFAALPLVSLRGEHVQFDSLDPHLPAWFRRAQWVVVNVLVALLLLALAWLMWQTGADFAAFGETTAQLQVPKYPFIYGMGVLCALTGLVHLALVAQHPADRVEQEGTAL